MLKKRTSPYRRRHEQRANPAIPFQMRRSFLFLCAFVLFYLEPLRLGPLNVASYWKLGGLAIAFYLYAFSADFSAPPRTAFWGAAFAIAGLINISLWESPIETLTYSIKFLYIPAILVILMGLHRKHGLTVSLLLGHATFIAAFATLSTIPFHLGLLEPMTDAGYDLSLFGLEGKGFSGIFFSSHGASIVLGTAS
ncbi:hypothetical protein C9928_07445, partial [Pseudidiomarina aestuarii]